MTWSVYKKHSETGRKDFDQIILTNDGLTSHDWFHTIAFLHQNSSISVCDRPNKRNKTQNKTIYRIGPCPAEDVFNVVYTRQQGLYTTKWGITIRDASLPNRQLKQISLSFRNFACPFCWLRGSSSPSFPCNFSFFSHISWLTLPILLCQTAECIWKYANWKHTW